MREGRETRTLADRKKGLSKRGGLAYLIVFFSSEEGGSREGIAVEGRETTKTSNGSVRSLLEATDRRSLAVSLRSRPHALRPHPGIHILPPLRGEELISAASGESEPFWQLEFVSAGKGRWLQQQQPLRKL